jgi:antitoxin component YwqK of YwqJK toxin-antitoxin module
MFHKNGLKWKFYILENGKAAGPSIQWRDDGTLKWIKIFDAVDKCLIDMQCSEKGEPLEVIMYDAETFKIRIRQQWHENGIRALRQTYNDQGEPNGAWQEWSEDGVQTKETHYHNGKKAD